ncbi:carbon-nitrogen hydrolase family protein [Tissierella creatinini]|nr:carbon-nitrogen hydrolase family protein [Tissierella creatinini]TJX61008.1 carbon-nitrogen hydrolase family protein [Soehngenia saccharolytica]
MSVIKVANIQMKVSANKEDNFTIVNKYLEDISKEKIDLVVLPEMFNCPYQTPNFPIYAEEEGGNSWQACSSLAKKYNIYLIAGSMPEKDKNGKVYNTSYVFDRQGKQIGKHRKVHLFDVDIKGGQYFKESDTLTPGNQVTVFETEFGIIGLCICFDFRFPELSRLIVEKGAKVIVVPGAFNMTTGPLHWELLFRLRAVDNQVFTIGASPARDPESGYTSWGHSLVVSPWGDIINEMDEKEGYIISELDLDLVEKVRKELPLLAHRRHDMYKLEELKCRY